MPKFRKRPVVIEAWKYTGQDAQDWPDWVLDYRQFHTQQVRLRQDSKLNIPTLEGTHVANIGDWIIQGIKGELYPCHPALFDATYEPAE